MKNLHSRRNKETYTMEDLTNLYPQYRINKDRRQQTIPVAVDRRSGSDRRGQDRVALDSQLTKDLYKVKSQVAKLENIAPKFFTNNITTQNPSFASMNNMTQDQLVKETKPDPSAIARQEAQLKDKADTSFKIGILAAALAGAMAISFLGPVGTVIGVGTGIYIGARVVKTLISREVTGVSDLKKENNTRK